MFNLHFICARARVCVLCVLQSAGSVAVPPDTGLRPTCFWGREDKREINCSTSSPASALLLREQFVGWHTREGMRGGGHSNDLPFLGDPVIQQWFPALDLGRRSWPPPRVTDSECFTECDISQSVIVSHPQFVFFPPRFCTRAHSDTLAVVGPVKLWQKAELTCLWVPTSYLLLSSPPLSSLVSPPLPSSSSSSSSSSSPPSCVGCNYKHSFGESAALLYGMMTMQDVCPLEHVLGKYMLSHCRHKNAACINE